MEEIDLIDMFKYYVSKKVIIILVGIVCVIFAIVYTKFLLVPEYTATSRLILTNNKLETEADVYSYSQLPARYYAIADSKNVMDKVVENLKLDINDVLAYKESNVEISYKSEHFLINVKVNTDDAKKSSQIANEIVKVTIEEIKNIYNDENVQILDYAVENWNPTNVNLVSTVLKFVLIGEVLVGGIIVIKYIFVEDLKKKNI